MKMCKVLLIALLMLCASGIYAQEQKYFTGMLVKEAGKTHFVAGNIMNSPEEILNHLEFKDVTPLWTGKGKIKNDKIVWVNESNLFVIDEELDNKVFIKSGDGIKALKAFLNSKEGSAIKKKFFTPTTGYITSNEFNPYTSRSLKALEYPFKKRLLDNNLTLIQNIVDEVKAPIIEMGTFEGLDKNIMQSASKAFLSIYESAMLIEPSLNTTAYQEAKPYLEKINSNSSVISTEGLKTALKNLTADINETCKNSLYESIVVIPEYAEAADHLFMEHTVENETWSTVFPYTIEDALTDLKGADLTNAGSLLGEHGLLTIALDEAISEMTDWVGTPKKAPDVKACSYIQELALTIIDKLLEGNTEIDLRSLETKLTILSNRINTYKKVTMDKAGTETSLDKILEKKTLGEVELYELFGKEDGIAASIMKQYNKDTNDPFNAVRLLVVEGLRRRFEEAGNQADAPKYLFYAIRDNAFFKSDSETYKNWKKGLDVVKEEQPEAKTTEDKEKLDDYKLKIESISKFEVK